MQNKPRWQKILIWADLVCVVGALIFLTAAIFLGPPEGGLHGNLRFVSWAMMGVHFVLHGILNWEEHRWLAVFELSIVAFSLIAILLAFLR